MDPILDIPAHIKALPEPEQGPALVDAIHQRKQLQQAWEHYAGIPAPTYDPFKATKEKLAELSAEVGKPVQYTRRFNGPSSLQVMVDGHWKPVYATDGTLRLTEEEDLFWNEVTLQTARTASVEMTWQDVSGEFIALLMGAPLEELRRQQEERRQLWDTVGDVLARTVDAPPVDADNVRWPSHNRKLYARRDGTLSELHRMLGVEPNDGED